MSVKPAAGAVFLLILFMAPAAPAQAQRVAFTPAVEASAVDVAPNATYPVHASDWLNSRPENQAYLAEFHRKKALGLLPAAKTHDDPQVGDLQSFRVLNFEETQATNNRVMDNIEFELVATGERFFLWVELAELTSENIGQADIDEIVQALGESTPALSINPNAGIIENDEVIFGDPPDLDGDGKSDVLVLDIRDGLGPPGAFIGGFVDTADLTGVGNNRDVLYLDSNNRLEDLGLTAAHEYHHLIHFNYNERLFVSEVQFVNEGLSEWAELANGYEGRRISYLSQATDYNVRFLQFREPSDPNVDKDYQRAGLWTTYLADQIGTDGISRITRESSTGLQGYNNVLDDFGLDAAETVLDFHIANLFNDTSVDLKYGYTTPQRAGVQAVPRHVFDARTTTQTPSLQLQINPGAAEYLVFDVVQDLSLSINVSSGGTSLLPQALLMRDGALVETRPITVNVDEDLISGAYDQVVVLLTHAVPDGNVPVTLSFNATWNADEVFESQEVVYDDGVAATDDTGQFVAYNICDPDTGTCVLQQANHFEVPPSAILSSVGVAPYYDHDFTGSTVPASAPRDFRLHVWEAVSDGATGFLPGPELFSTDVEDGRTNSGGGMLNFLSIDLNPFTDQLSTLPGNVFIGISDTGTDVNYMALSVTKFEEPAEQNPSVMFLDGLCGGDDCWAAFQNITAGGETILQDRVLPIRATFLVPDAPTATDDALEVPASLTLHANYPNPFNPTTTIAYDLPQAADVHLAVYDLLGRRIATLVDAVQTAGAHQVAVDATGWASGVYLYTIEAGAQRQTRRMVLMK